MVRIFWSEGQEFAQSNGVVTLETATNVIEFDADVRVLHNLSALSTEQAVEAGASISDHKIAQNARLTLECMVTNTPFDAPPRSGFDATITTTRDENGRLVFSPEFSRTGDVFRALEVLVEQPILVGIETPLQGSGDLKIYENMSIVSVDAPIESMDAIQFSIEAVQTRVVSTRTVDTPSPRELRSGRVRNSGSQQTQDTAASTDTALQRLANSGGAQTVRDGLGNVLGFLVGG